MADEVIVDAPDKKKQKYYKQRYLPKWEEDYRFQGWLTQCKEDPDYAYCAVCHTKILSRVASLVSHYMTNKHKKHMKMNKMNDWIETDDTPKFKSIKAENIINDFVEEDITDSMYEPAVDGRARETQVWVDSVRKTLRKRDFKFGMEQEYEGFEEFYGENSAEFDDNDSDLINATLDAHILKRDMLDSPPKKKMKKLSNTKSEFGSNVKLKENDLTFELNDDEFTVYGKHVANELRQIKDDFAQQAAKMKINTILFEARTGNIKVTTNQTNTTEQPTAYEYVVC